jgi:hypothetical protein
VQLFVTNECHLGYLVFGIEANADFITTFLIIGPCLAKDVWINLVLYGIEDSYKVRAVTHREIPSVRAEVVPSDISFNLNVGQR